MKYSKIEPSTKEKRREKRVMIFHGKSISACFGLGLFIATGLLCISVKLLNYLLE